MRTGRITVRIKNPILSARRRSPESAVVRLQLTSLVDMMTILLIFLLKSFSMDGEVLTPAADLALPGSTSDERVAPMVNVAVTRTGVLLDGRSLLTLDELASLPSEAATIGILETELTKLAAITGDADGDRALTIQCDKNLDFALLKRVMRTCSVAGFDDFALLVQKEAA
jgi:biopolymer transport protein ExbD